VFIFTTLGFISVFLNALLGAVVVNSNLIGGIVTAHFIAAFASICFFIIARHFAQPFPSSILTSGQKRMAFFLMILIAIQVILGAELRELYDVLNHVLNFGEKTNALAPTFQYHGLLGILTAIMAIYQLIKIPKTYKSIKYVKWIAILAVAQLGFGPMALLPETASISKLFHISFGAAIFVLQFYICTAFISTSKSER